jgi:hypothetical protein
LHQNAAGGALSLIGVVLAREFDSNAAARQRLSKKNLNFGVHAP